MKAVIGAVLLWGVSAQATFESETSPFSFFGTQMDGLKITRSPNSSPALINLGVKEGDVLVKVNDVELSSVETAQHFFVRDHLISAVIVRSGKVVTLKAAK